MWAAPLAQVIILSQAVPQTLCIWPFLSVCSFLCQSLGLTQLHLLTCTGPFWSWSSLFLCVGTGEGRGESLSHSLKSGHSWRQKKWCLWRQKKEKKEEHQITSTSLCEESFEEIAEMATRCKNCMTLPNGLVVKSPPPTPYWVPSL